MKLFRCFSTPPLEELITTIKASEREEASEGEGEDAARVRVKVTRSLTWFFFLSIDNSRKMIWRLEGKYFRCLSVLILSRPDRTHQRIQCAYLVLPSLKSSLSSSQKTWKKSLRLFYQIRRSRRCRRSQRLSRWGESHPHHHHTNRNASPAQRLSAALSPSRLNAPLLLHRPTSGESCRGRWLPRDCRSRSLPASLMSQQPCQADGASECRELVSLFAALLR
jgi:hypothetical protein